MLKGNKITILTEPTYESPMTNIGAFKRYVKKVLRYAQRGPNAVLRSLMNGFKCKGVNFNYNPKSRKDIGGVVIVLSHIEALREAIELKRAGKIKKLLAGPNLVNLPSDNLELITHPLIDYYLVNSQWTYDMYIQDAPVLRHRCLIWPTGVDAAFWKPEHDLTEGTVLIYEKTSEPALVRHCKDILQRFGYNIQQIKYGQYTPKAYLRKLRASEFAVFFSQV